MVALVIVIVIAAVANSPFGLFFAQEPNAPGTVSVSQAVGSVNMAYNTKLELLQTGDYDSMGKQKTVGSILRGLRGSKSQEKIASELGITKSARAPKRLCKRE